jgi:hypothetical protein
VEAFLKDEAVAQNIFKGMLQNGPKLNGAYTNNGICPQIILPEGTPQAQIDKMNELYAAAAAEVSGTPEPLTDVVETSSEVPAAPQRFTLTVSDAGVATLYLPYAVEIPDAPYFVPCIVNDIYIDPWNYLPGTATMQRLKEGVIPANTGVIINANPGTYTLRSTDKETSEDLSGNWLKGVTENTRKVDLEYNYNFVDANGDGKDDAGKDPYYSIFTAMRGTTTSIGFFYDSAHNWDNGWNNTTATFAANKAFIRVLDANLTPAVKELGFVFVGDETTAIEDVKPAADKTSDGVLYNLNGQRVDAPAKGIYIKNGKKVFVK